jgi:polysaccharide transporter, PST family
VHPRKFIRDSIGFVASQYVIRALLIVRGVVGMRLLGPLGYGAWNAIQLMMDYGGLATLGTQQGLDQTVPARILENDQERLDRLKRAGLFNVLVSSLVFVGLCLAYMAAKPSRITGNWGPVGVALALGCVVLTNLSYYYMTLLRSHGNIHAVSGWFLIQGAIGTVVGLALIPVAGMWGLLIGWTVATLAATLFVQFQSHGRVPLLPRPSLDGTLLLRVGFPMFVFLSSNLVMRSIDRVIILKFLGTQMLGYYSVAVMALMFLLYLPDAIAFVLYPRLLREFHASGDRPEAVRATVDRFLRGLAVVMPLLCGLAYLCARDAVLLVLPKFFAGVTALRVLTFGAGALSFVSVASITLMTLQRGRLLLPAAAGMIALGAGLDLLAVWLGAGINGVARATIASYVVNSSILLWLAFSGLRMTVSERLAGMLRTFLPLVLSFALAYGLDKALPWDLEMGRVMRFARMAFGALLFIGIYGVLVLPLVRGLGFRRLMTELNLRLPFTVRRAEAPRP